MLANSTSPIDPVPNRVPKKLDLETHHLQSTFLYMNQSCGERW